MKWLFKTIVLHSPAAHVLLFFVVCGFYGCSKHAPYSYKITALELYNVDNSGISPVDASTPDIVAKAYAIRLEYTDMLSGSTAGTEPYESGYLLTNKVTSFVVWSLTGFDASHPAGVSLNDYFLYGIRTTAVRSGDTIEDDLNLGYIAPGYRSDTPAEGQPWKSSDYLVLMQPPANPGPRSFVINIGFADNTHITDTISVTLH